MDDVALFAADAFRIAPGLADTMRAGGDDPREDQDLPTLWLGRLGRALARCLDDLSPTARTGLSDLLEDALTGRSDTLRSGVATGLLEALSDEVVRGRVPAPSVRAFLGPRARAYVDAWDAFSLGRSSLSPDGPTSSGPTSSGPSSGGPTSGGPFGRSPSGGDA